MTPKVLQKWSLQLKFIPKTILCLNFDKSLIKVAYSSVPCVYRCESRVAVCYFGNHLRTAMWDQSDHVCKKGQDSSTAFVEKLGQPIASWRRPSSTAIAPWGEGIASARTVKAQRGGSQTVKVGTPQPSAEVSRRWDQIWDRGGARLKT